MKQAMLRANERKPWLGARETTRELKPIPCPAAAASIGNL
jgi:hypothetical protein